MREYVSEGSKRKNAVFRRVLVPALTTLSFIGLMSIAPACANAANNPVPFIDQPLTPAAAAPGSSVTLRVRGVGFVSSSVVNWNGNALATTFVSSRTLSAAVPAADLASPETASVTVVNPTPGGGTSNVVFFQVIRPTSTVIMPQSDNALDVGDSIVVTGDFNHDGKLDVAALAGAPDTVTVLLGNGNGTFQAPVDYPNPTGLDGSGIAVGDFNGDGNLDFAITSENALTPGVVNIMLGNGDGTFQPPGPTIAVNGSPACIATADVNGDGKLDLVVGYDYADDGFLSVLLGNGDGTFGPPVDYAAGKYTNSVLLADFNNDGKIDIATIDRFGTDASLLLGNGNGTFGAPSVYYNQLFPNDFTAADFNGDGNEDIAVAGAILLGNGDGTFRQGGIFNGPTTTQSLAAGDFNGDGKLDLAGPSTTSSIAIDLGNGDGTFQPALTIPLVGSESIPVPSWVATGDFNGDGHLDLAVADSDGLPGAVTALLQSTLQLTPASLVFPATVIGSSRSQAVKVMNFGAAPVSLGSISVTGIDPSDFSITSACGATLAPGKTCPVTVTFKPTAEGNRQATLSVLNATIGLAQSVGLYGTGTAVSLSPSSLNFGNEPVGETSSAETVTLTNQGTTVLSITAVNINGTNPADFAQTNNCGTSLGAGASCTINVTFTPTATGSRSAHVLVYDNGGGSPQITSLAGTGT
jgi:hypothetical protein